MQFSNWKRIIVVIGLLLIAGVTSSLGAEPAPAGVMVALTVKLAALEKNVASGGDLSIWVIGSPKVAAEFKKVAGKAIGKATLKNVGAGDALPTAKPNILCLCDPAMLADVIKYTRENKVLSITNDPDLVTKGISLGIGIGEGGKPAVSLNVTASKEEGLDWNPAIMKVAKTVK